MLMSATHCKTITTQQIYVFIGYSDVPQVVVSEFSSRRHLIQVERLVESSNTQFKVFFVDYHRHLDFGR